MVRRCTRILLLLGIVYCIIAGVAASATGEVENKKKQKANEIEQGLSHDGNKIVAYNNAKPSVMKKISKPTASDQKKYYKQAENKPGKIESKAEYHRRMKSTGGQQVKQFSKTDEKVGEANDRKLYEDREVKNNSRYSTSAELDQDERRLYNWWWGYKKRRRWGWSSSSSKKWSSSSSSKKWGWGKRKYSWGNRKWWRPWWYSW